MGSSRKPAVYTSRISASDLDRWSCRTRSIANFRMPRAIGFGSGCFRRRSVTRTRRRERSVAIIFTNRLCSGGACGGAARSAREARHVSYVPAFVRDASSRAGPGHPDSAGASGPSRCNDDDDLYTGSTNGRERRAQPAGRFVIMRPDSRSLARQRANPFRLQALDDQIPGSLPETSHQGETARDDAHLAC
jgi:hypothetical protein